MEGSEISVSGALSASRLHCDVSQVVGPRSTLILAEGLLTRGQKAVTMRRILHGSQVI